MNILEEEEFNVIFNHAKYNLKKYEYIKISNKGGKEWIIPTSNIRLGLLIYQPSSLLGKGIKLLLPYIKNCRICSRIIDIKINYFQITRDLEYLFKKLGVEDNYYISLFSGTPGSHKKITLQLYSENRILGYCKISSNPEVIRLFKKEAYILDQLNKKGVQNIPKCLYCEEIIENSGIYIFIQDTVKTKKSTYTKNLCQLHYNFLENIYLKTSSCISYQECEFRKMIDLIRKSSYLNPYFMFDSKYDRAILNAIERIDRNISKLNCFYFYHGDFTPWNMFIENNNKQLYVFDFEYSKFGYPPFLDIFHYFTQTRIFEKNLTAEQIITEYRESSISYELSKLMKKMNIFELDIDDLYICYLLEISFRYAKINYKENMLNNYIIIWLDLIEMLVN